MVEIAAQVLSSTLPVALGGLFGLILAHLRSKRALKVCQEAKMACNDKVHALEAALTVAQIRIVALEREFDLRLKALEPQKGDFDPVER